MSSFITGRIVVALVLLAPLILMASPFIFLLNAIGLIDIDKRLGKEIDGDRFMTTKSAKN